MCVPQLWVLQPVVSLSIAFNKDRTIQGIQSGHFEIELIVIYKRASAFTCDMCGLRSCSALLSIALWFL